MRIDWLIPNNGFYIAALKDFDYEMKLPNSLSTFEENLTLFKSVWMNLDYDLCLLYENIENHFATKEYCCLDCHFPFVTVCTDLYSQFEPEPPPNPQYGFYPFHIQDSFSPTINIVLVYLYTPLYWNIVIGSLQLKLRKKKIIQ